MKKETFIQRQSKEQALDVGSHIRLARQRRNITIAELAKRVGVTNKTISRLENGDSKVAIGTVLATLSALGLVDQFVDSISQGKDIIGWNLTKPNTKRVRKIKGQLTYDPASL